MVRIQKGPVRGISLALQEEERERRDNYVPDVSVMERMTSNIEVDADTKEMLQAIDFGSLASQVTIGNRTAYRDDRKRRQFQKRD
jgi:small subunit ribosomal protein S17e